MRAALVLFAALLLGGRSVLAPATVAHEMEETVQPAADDPGAFAGLPAGMGREAAYFTCTACHSVKQFTQQRMDRDDWHTAIDRMIEKNGMHLPEPWAYTLILNYLVTHYGADDEDFGGLPPGPGREEVYYVCDACHSVMLVAQQRLSRKIWDETLVWMVEEQDMPELEPDERDAILTYLSTQLSAETPR
jgi:cytochrome c